MLALSAVPTKETNETPRPERQRLDFTANAAARAAVEEDESLFGAVIGKVRRGELSRAASLLTASPIAPGTRETLDKLTDPRRRPTQLFRPIREEDLQHQPARRLDLDQRRFLENVRSAKRGSAAGRCGLQRRHRTPSARGALNTRFDVSLVDGAKYNNSRIGRILGAPPSPD